MSSGFCATPPANRSKRWPRNTPQSDPGVLAQRIVYDHHHVVTVRAHHVAWVSMVADYIRDLRAQ